MQAQRFYVYMAVSQRGTLYTGMTRDISIRGFQHASGNGGGFSSKYRTTKLVWCEVAESFESAREREAQIKRWRRSKKATLIEMKNPYWRDISNRLS